MYLMWEFNVSKIQLIPSFSLFLFCDWSFLKHLLGCLLSFLDFRVLTMEVCSMDRLNWGWKNIFSFPSSGGCLRLPFPVVIDLSCVDCISCS